MARFDRYMLSQLLVLFGFFSLILILIYWINRAVVLFDQLIADGQSAWVFLELTSLSLPGLIRIVLPLSAFVAAVYVTNRMASESELTVVQATGYSPYRLARPVIWFGLIVALMMAVLTHFLVPLATQQLRERQDEIAQNVTARLLSPGEFLTPPGDVTFYIREISQTGEMLDLFISENTDPDRSLTYTADRAYLVKTEKGPQLVMVNGLVQDLDRRRNRLTTTGFEDFVYDIGGLIDGDRALRRSASSLMTWELFNPTPAILDEVHQTAGQLMVRGHDRFGEAFLGFVAGLIGFSALIAGGFSRFGLWRNIALAVFLVVVVKGLESTGTNLARSDPALWPFMYLAGLGGLAISFALLWIAAHPYALKRRPRAPGGAS